MGGPGRAQVEAAIFQPGGCSGAALIPDPDFKGIAAEQCKGTSAEAYSHSLGHMAKNFGGEYNASK